MINEKPEGVSLVLATVGRTSELEQLFQSLAMQREREFEVIIVDQNPDQRLDALISVAAQDGLRVKHVRLAERNLAKARNVGIQHSRYGIVGFPDDDCWYDASTLEHVRNEFSRAADVDGISGRWVELEPDGQGAGGDLSLHGWRRFSDGNASSICLFVRREILISIGGFDERLGVGQWYGAGEETDLVMRLLGAGARVVRTNRVLVHHPISRSAVDWRVTFVAVRKRARGTGALYAKHRLSAAVIVRGLVGPLGRWLLPSHRRLKLIEALAISLGRLEGYVIWRLRER